MIFTTYIDEKLHKVKIVQERGGYLIKIDNENPFHIDVVDLQTGSYSMLLKGRSYQFDIEKKENSYNVLLRGRLYSIELIPPTSKGIKGKGFEEKKIIARMPGKIIKILAKEKDKVTKGEGVVIMEAMKMENELKSPMSGVIQTIHVKEGQTVEAGEDLILLE